MAKRLLCVLGLFAIILPVDFATPCCLAKNTAKTPVIILSFALANPPEISCISLLLPHYYSISAIFPNHFALPESFRTSNSRRRENRKQTREERHPCQSHPQPRGPALSSSTERHSSNYATDTKPFIAASRPALESKGQG